MDIYDDGKAFEVEPKLGEDGRPTEGEPMNYAIQLDEIERKSGLR